MYDQILNILLYFTAPYLSTLIFECETEPDCIRSRAAFSEGDSAIQARTATAGRDDDVCNVADGGADSDGGGSSSGRTGRVHRRRAGGGRHGSSECSDGGGGSAAGGDASARSAASKPGQTTDFSNVLECLAAACSSSSL